MSQNTMSSLIESAIELESKARDLYITFSEMFSLEDRVSAFWQQYSEDESQHMNMLVEIRNALSQEELLSPVGEKEFEGVLRVRQLLVQDFVGLVHTLNDAYDLALTIEDSELNAIFNLLLIKYLPSEKVETLIFHQIDEHINKLMNFGKDFSVSQRKLVVAMK